MCRPLWAAWVDDKHVLSVGGEGSHSELMDAEIMLSVAEKSQKSPTIMAIKDRIFEITGLEFATIDFDTAQPFEAAWTQKREAQWQPNTNRFYSHDDMPTRKHFDLAQERFEKDMGTPDLLRDWVMAGAKLFGEEEIDNTFLPGNTGTPFAAWVKFVMARSLGGTEGLFLAASKILINPENRVLWGDLQWTMRKEDTGQRAFHRWADIFSDSKNRVDLWKN